jgi:hypothetical protein
MREASSIPNTEGAIPLHLAANHRCSKEVIQVLLNEDANLLPAAVLTRAGRAPIHYACLSFRGLSLPAFQLLLEATLKTGQVNTNTSDLEDLMEDDEYSQFEEEEPRPELNVVTMRDSTGQTPLGLLFRRYRERVRIVIQSMERMHPLAAALRVQADLGEMWEKARWIVARLAQEAQPHMLIGGEIHSPGEQAIAQEAAVWAREQFSPSSPKNGQHPRKKTFRIVHASVSLTGYGCPPEMIRLALSIHPNQVGEMDEHDGSLPIHICAMAPSLVFNDPARNDDDSSFISEFSFFSHTTSSVPNAFDKVFKILLEHYPAAARIPHGQSGKLPLILALDARTWDDGIQSLLDAYPAALESKRWFPIGLYPWMLARIGNRRSRKKSCTAIFELLKAKPDLVKRD